MGIRMLKRGDQIKCINNKYENIRLNLTEGKTYTVLRVCSDFVYIENDKRLKWGYPLERFVNKNEIKLPARFWTLTDKD